jgi:hypothetical protein
MGWMKNASDVWKEILMAKTISSRWEDNIKMHSKEGESGSLVVKALCYKPEGRGFET